MKTLIICFLFLFLPFLLIGQDTIFLKSGSVIPALIQEKGDVEIKYKKFVLPPSAAIYSVFINDVAKIHYKNGKLETFNTAPAKELPVVDLSQPIMKFTVGLSVNYFERQTSDNLKIFWQVLNNDPTLNLSGNNRYFAVNLGMGSPMGTTKRNWFGAALQLMLTPSNAIYASNTYNAKLNEIKLGAFYYDIYMYYGHTLDHKKNLILLIEPGIDMVMLHGYIKRDDVKYSESAMAGISFQLSAGLDWNISKRIQANLRVGEQFVKIKEEHKDDALSSGYGSWYINPPSNMNLVSVDWSGPFASIGLSYAMYAKMGAAHHAKAK